MNDGTFTTADLISQARDLVVKHQRASISLVQRHMKIRYNLAARLLERLEVDGVVSPMDPIGVRTVLLKGGAA